MTNRHRFYRYPASGGISTTAHYLTLYALVQMRTEPMLGSTIAALVELMPSYSVDRRWVFDVSAKIPETIARFALVWMLVLLVNTWALTSLLTLGFHYLVTQVTATGVLVLINFNLHRRWTFSDTRMLPFGE